MISEQEKQEYKKYVEEVTPNHNIFRDMGLSFIFGGALSVLAQAVANFAMSYGADKTDAATWAAIALMTLSGILTCFGWYKHIVKFAGAGLIVPITGFANSVISTAIEYKNEGQVVGIGSKIFTIAGPVILYGVVTSWVVGLIYWIIRALGWW